MTNPFTILVLTSMGWQLAFALVVFIPFWLSILSVWVRSRDPRYRRLLGIVVSILVVGAFHLAIPDAPAGRAPAGFNAEFADQCPPLGEAADALGLDPKDRLVDVRPPAHYGAYHVAGSCNLDPRRLREDGAYRAALEDTPGPLLLVTEWQVTIKPLYDAILSTGASPRRWQVLEAGSLFFQLNPSVGNAKRLVGSVSGLTWSTRDAINTERLNRMGPQLEVDEAYRLPSTLRAGQFLACKSGPIYAQGWPVSILGGHPAWREHRQMALWRQNLRDVVHIEVRDTSSRPYLEVGHLVPGVPWIVSGRMDVRVEDFDEAFGAPVEKAIFLCDNGMTCMAAEALAASMIERGDSVLGYATTEWPTGTDKWDKFSARLPLRGVPGLPWSLWGLAILVAATVPTAVRRRLSALALRPPRSRERPVLVGLLYAANAFVPVAAGDTAAVTSGNTSVVRWGRIGAFSKTWISGSLGPRDLPAWRFHDAFAVLERRFAGPITVEWAWTGRAFLVLQVRPAPAGNTDGAEAAHTNWPGGLASALSRHNHKAADLVLDGSGLSDLQFGAGSATRRFVSALYRRGPRFLATGGLMHRWASAVGPHPPVVALDGGLFLNRVPRRPFAALMILPPLRFANRILRWRWRSRCDALERRVANRRDQLVRLAGSDRVAPDADATKSRRRAWDLVTGPVAADFLDAGILLDAMDPRGKVRGGLPDPLLAAAASGPEALRRLADILPYRSLREWALEHPRIGEDAPGWDAMIPAFAARDRCFPDLARGRDRASRVARASRLTALARDNLSFGASWLRRLAIESGNPQEQGPQPDPALPAAFTLAGLERWTSGDHGDRYDAGRGFWVSGAGPLTGVVVASVDEACRLAGTGTLPIRVVNHPEVREAAHLPDGTAVVATGGNRLSHAAQVLAERRIPALFGTEAFRHLLVPGARVVLKADGTIAPAPVA